MPYKNDEKAPDSRLLKLVSRTKISEKFISAMRI